MPTHLQNNAHISPIARAYSSRTKPVGSSARTCNHNQKEISKGRRHCNRCQAS